jgi:hypothetical protein
MAIVFDASRLPKEDQYRWCLSLVWGKMVSDATCERFSRRCPDLAKIGIICPTFDEYDIARIVPLYMAKYPEHRGYEERLKWILRCIFSPGMPATPPGVTRPAPYVPRTRTPTQTQTARVTTLKTQVVIPAWVKIGGVILLAYFVSRK